MSKMKIIGGMALVLFILAGSFSESPAAGIYLPDPDRTYDGVYIAWAHDDFWSYSAPTIDLLQKAGYISWDYGNFRFATGSGGLDVILFTGAAGQTNQGVGPGGAFDLENPVYDPGGSTKYFEGSWGLGGPADSGPVTVGQVLAYLNALDQAISIPAFYMDLNQTGNSPDLWFSAQVRLLDPVTMETYHLWAFDTLPQGVGPQPPGDDHWPGFGYDGDYDPDYPALALGKYEQTGDSGTLYSVDHNKGSGKPSYIAYAPSMDLSLFNPDLLFVVEFRMGTPDGGFGALNNGFEEIFLTGLRVSPPTRVPEPMSLLLLGIGLMGLAGVGRRMKR